MKAIYAEKSHEFCLERCEVAPLINFTMNQVTLVTGAYRLYEREDHDAVRTRYPTR